MSTATIDTTVSPSPPVGMGDLMLIATGVLLLAVGALIAGWEPMELPLGLATLGTLALALCNPSRWLAEEGLDTVNSLVLASLITLSGFHLLA
ncbi:hypothetical protein [Halomonas sp.]|uniref:hypothetical protein n=1 Tax=Halomonas sp. TaxID=1486246 RepID=UPI00298DE5C7|nr:hypothetical protein [Halomonas sp.]MDW7747858.1 hypothetical protein [Halomonas sp.]